MSLSVFHAVNNLPRDSAGPRTAADMLFAFAAIDPDLARARCASEIGG